VESPSGSVELAAEVGWYSCGVPFIMMAVKCERFFYWTDECRSVRSATQRQQDISPQRLIASLNRKHVIR
jgi:hypothetical protein